MSQDTVGLETCGTCGGHFPEPLRDDPDRCRCYRARKNTAARLAYIDPNARMTLRRMTQETQSMKGAREKGLGALAWGAASGGKGLFLFGPPGIGKTHLLVGLTRVALEAGFVATWQNVATLGQEVRDTYFAGTPWELRRTALLEKIIAHDVVMLDDLGRERDTEDARSIVYELIDGLYSMRRTVFLATNLSLEEYESRYDEAVRSRLAHMARKLDVKGPDRRRKEPYAR